MSNDAMCRTCRNPLGDQTFDIGQDYIYDSRYWRWWGDGWGAEPEWRYLNETVVVQRLASHMLVLAALADGCG